MSTSHLIIFDNNFRKQSNELHQIVFIIIRAIMLTSVYLFCCFLIAITVSEKLQLEKVIVLSRHNVRTPLSEHLAEMTPKPWPHFDEKSGYLTPKGAYLEGLMGAFFSKWLFHEGLLPLGCPDKNDVFVYANTKQRTRASARAFVINAFPDCNVTVNVKEETDPIFNPVVHNNTDIFKQLASETMKNILNSLQMNSSYELMESILDYKDSNLCKAEHKCDLETDKNVISDITVGEKPSVKGPLNIGKGAVDGFVMEYYNGFTQPNVAWGQLDSVNSWKTAMKLSEGYHNVIFNSTILGRDIALPLIKYMKDIFLNKTTKFSLLMGHDANIFTVLSGMRFKPYTLPNQYEKAPIGGKIMFQRWSNRTGHNFLKIQYVYGSTDQLRLGLKLTLLKPPQFKLLELGDCPIDDNGFCSWDCFEKLINEF